MKVAMPYGSTHLTLEIPDEVVAGVLVPAYPRNPAGPAAIEDALRNPVASPRLKDLVKGKRNVVLLSPDHTRAMPSKFTVPPLLQEIREGNPGAGVTLLVATGLHRAPTRQELEDRYGQPVLDSVKVAVHDPDDPASHADLGILPSGAPLRVDRRALEADLLISEGLIEPHFFAGYSGGRKNVLPGIADRSTVYYNHSAGLIGHHLTNAGSLDGNLLTRDMDEAARRVRLAFILNVSTDDRKNVISAFAGDPAKAHRAGCDFLRRISTVKAGISDITVVTNGGYPLDQNLYQAVKGMYTASRTTREGGVIICLAECRDGVGGENFLDLAASAPSPEELLRRIMRTPAGETVMDQWEVHSLVQVLSRQRVVLVSENISPDVARSMHLLHAPSTEEAMRMAQDLVGGHGSVTVIPDGVQVIVP